MKTFIRNVFINTLSLFFLAQFVPGIQVAGGTQSFLTAGLAFTLIGFLVQPILNLITLPLRFLTFGLSSLLVNGFVLYLLTVVVPNISVMPFVFKGLSIVGFVIPQVSLNLFFAYIASALILSVIVYVLRWLVKN